MRAVLVALLVLVAALVLEWAPLLPASLALLAGVYAAQLYVDDATLDGAAPLFAAGLFVTAEFGYWSLEERERVEAAPGEGLRRLAIVAVLGLVALVVAASLLALADIVRTRGLAVDVLGAAAAAAALSAIVVLAGRRV
ncbi:MAG: hypothetical protein A2Y55_01410 [Actinobacteria bacterium RBG_16_68_12]|nr:MAG: hypothetical protein A2Y55_01410 [Actinobacteria bacterium RBG_16_68_12]